MKYTINSLEKIIDNMGISNFVSALSVICELKAYYHKKGKDKEEALWNTLSIRFTQIEKDILFNAEAIKAAKSLLD